MNQNLWNDHTDEERNPANQDAGNDLFHSAPQNDGSSSASEEILPLNEGAEPPFDVAAPAELLHYEDEADGTEEDRKKRDPQTLSALSDDAGIGPVVESVKEDLRRKRPLVFSESNPLPSRMQDKAVRRENQQIPDLQTEQRPPLDRTLYDDDSSLGQLLTAARKSAGMTLQQVVLRTRIRTDYLTALENDDMKRLPPSVFISAYIRTLSGLYELDDDFQRAANEKLKKLSAPAEVPSKLLEELESDATPNPVEEKRIKRVIYMLSAGALLLLTVLILAVWGIVKACSSDVDSDAQSVSAGSSSFESSQTPADTGAVSSVFNSADLETLNAPQVPGVSVLEINKQAMIGR